MELSELLERLTALAGEVGLEVREVRAGAEGDPPLASGVCRLRGETWVLLAASDALEQRVEVLARALQSHAGARLEGRYLPPAVRARLAGGPEVG
jgi:hypothetical protein